MKKILSILLTMLMLVSVVAIAPVSTSAADAQEISVYFENNWLWTDVFVHTWGSSVGPNTVWGKGTVELVGTSEEGFEVYKATIGSDATGVIFAGTVNDGSGYLNQTPDITEGFYDGVCYSMLWIDGNQVVARDISDVCPDLATSEPEPEPEPDPEPDPEPTEEYTVYFVDYFDNFPTVYAYAWSGEGDSAVIDTAWPGKEMTATGESLSENAAQSGGLVYSCTFDTEYENIIFVGEYEPDYTVQTEDLTFEAGKYCYWGDEDWYDSIEALEEAHPAVETEPDDDTMTIYFQNNWLWTDVSIYYWYEDQSRDYEWPGVAMDYYDNDGTYDIYSCDIPVDAEGFVINGTKNDGTGAEDQTPDITEGFYDGICYYMLWDNGNQVGSEEIEVILPDHDFGGEGEEEEDETTKATFAGYSASLEGNINFKLYFDISNDVFEDPDAKVVITTPEGTIEYAVTECDEYNVYYAYSVPVPAKDMTSTITAQVVTELIETEEIETSVQEYLVAMLRNYGDFTQEQEIVKAMLNYGTAAQLYFGYNTDNLANDTEYMTEADKTVAAVDLSAYAPVIEGTNDGDVKYIGASLVLKSETSLKFYFQVENADQYENFGINVNGYSGAILVPNGDLYEFVINDLYAHELGETYTLATGCATIEYSALSYAYLAQQSSKTELVNLANALAAYYIASCNYNG